MNISNIKMNRYFITKHAQQRRPHHKVTPREVLIKVMKKLDEKIDFSKFNDGGIYKIYNKGKAAVIRRDKNKYILITLRGFTSTNIADITDIKITDVTNKPNIKVKRTNFVGREVTSGKIKLFEDGSGFIKLHPKLVDTFIIIDENIWDNAISFNYIEEIGHLVYKEDNVYKFQELIRK